MSLGFVSMVLLETPTGFAFFNVYERVFSGPESVWSWFSHMSFATDVITFRDFVKVDDKSVVLDDGPDERLADTIRKCCSDGRLLVVENEKLRDVIKSKLKINCFDNNEVTHELMWGFRNILYDILYQERCNITRQYLLPLSKGLIDCMDKYEINIPTQAVGSKLIYFLGIVDRCDARLKPFAKTIREVCDKLVPDIASVIKDDRQYAEVMTKILTPVLVEEEEWHPTQWFTDDVVKKIDAADAAADDARKKVDYDMHRLIYDCLVKLRKLPGVRGRYFKVKSLVDQISGDQLRKLH